MDRRTVLAALGSGASALAGCLGDVGGPSGGPSTTVDRWEGGGVRGYFDGGPARPECSVESERVEVEMGEETRVYETAATIPYPEPPDESSEAAILEYVEAFEEAYVTHDVLCGRRRGHVLEIGFNVKRRRTYDWYEEITTVFLHRAGAATSGVSSDGAMWVADIAFEGVVLAVDETGVARAEFDEIHEYDSTEYEARAPDPLEEGELVAAFD